MIIESQILNALSYVDDPDLNKDLVSLNMIKDVKIDDKKVSFTVVLTTPACPMKDAIENNLPILENIFKSNSNGLGPSLLYYHFSPVFLKYVVLDFLFSSNSSFLEIIKFSF